MWLLPHCHPFSSEIHPVTFYHESSRRFSNNIPPSFWPTYQTLQSYTERQSWKPAHVQAHKEGQLLSRCYRKQQLREQEWSRGWGGGRKDFALHGNGPKGKHSSDSRCGNTLYTQLLELHLASSDWLLELISWVCWQSLKWANTRCQDEQMRRCVCPWVSTRANETR